MMSDKGNTEFRIGQWWYSQNGNEMPVFYQVCNETPATVSFITVACKAERLGAPHSYLLTPTIDFDSIKKLPYKADGNVTIHPPRKMQAFIKRKPKRYKGYIIHSSNTMRPLIPKSNMEYTETSPSYKD
jgi:hypothetical protein